MALEGFFFFRCSAERFFKIIWEHYVFFLFYYWSLSLGHTQMASIKHSLSQEKTSDATTKSKIRKLEKDFRTEFQENNT